MNTTTRFPTFRAWGRCTRRWFFGFLRFLRRFFFSRRSLVVYVCLATLLALAWTLDLWLARRAWAQEKERLTAAGETTDLTKLLASRPPDEENFFAIPELAPLQISDAGHASNQSEAGKRLHMWLGWETVQEPPTKGRQRSITYVKYLIREDSSLAELCSIFRRSGALPATPLDADPAREFLLSAAQWQPMLDALSKGAKLPAAIVLPAPKERGGNYADYAGYGSWMPMVRALAIYQRAAVGAGESTRAMPIFAVIDRLADGLRDDGPLIASLVAASLEGIQARVILEGIKQHAWSREQLDYFSSLNSEERTVSSFRRALALERVHGEALIQMPENRGPYCVTYGNDRGMNLKTWLAGVHWKVHPEAAALRYLTTHSQIISRVLTAVPARAAGDIALLNILSDLSGSDLGYSALLPKLILSPRVAKTTFALERHYLAHGRYPASLQEIAASVDALTLTDVDGQHLRYQVTADGAHFTVWSLGRNGVDDTAAGLKGDKNDDILLTTGPRD